MKKYLLNSLCISFLAVLILGIAGCPSQKIPQKTIGGGSNDTSSPTGGPKAIINNSTLGPGSNDTSSPTGGPKLNQKKKKKPS